MISTKQDESLAIKKDPCKLLNRAFLGSYNIILSRACKRKKCNVQCEDDTICHAQFYHFNTLCKFQYLSPS